ncbi:hypothetical protein ACEQPO_23895 [Bacillus sp. SL00103]
MKNSSSSSAIQLKEGAYSVTVQYTGLTTSGTSVFNRTVIQYCMSISTERFMETFHITRAFHGQKCLRTF